MRINNTQNNKQNFKSISNLAKPLEQFYNANATIPTLAIETGVTLGRAYEANKRGGMPEAVDRLVEQGIGAVVWIYGVKILKNIGEFIGKKALKIENFDFDIGFDELRNPTKHINSKALGFKASNILISTALATYFMGAILPKINNAILKKTLKKQQKNKNNKKENIKIPSFNDFQNKAKKQTTPLAFTSLFNGVVNSAHVLENNSTARLLITDTGVVAGRFHNAPNKYRKIEGLFRDIASIYFYLFSSAHIVKGLNKLNKNTDINPKTLEKTVEMLIQKLNENPNISNEEFIKKAIQKPNNKNIESLKELFKENKVITVDDFIKKFPKFKKKAKNMAQLQYIENGNGVLSFQQAKDVLSNSWTSDSKFLKETYKYTTGKEIDSKTCFISSKYLDKTRQSIDNFIEQIERISKQKNYKIDKELIENVAKKTIKKNFIFNIFATAVSTFALGIMIPKIQYAITKKMTNENKFHTEEN